jgi:hypothetical protein
VTAERSSAAPPRPSCGKEDARMATAPEATSGVRHILRYDTAVLSLLMVSSNTSDSQEHEHQNQRRHRKKSTRPSRLSDISTSQWSISAIVFSKRGCPLNKPIASHHTAQKSQNLGSTDGGLTIRRATCDHTCQLPYLANAIESSMPIYFTRRSHIPLFFVSPARNSLYNPELLSSPTSQMPQPRHVTQ